MVKNTQTGMGMMLASVQVGEEAGNGVHDAVVEAGPLLDRPRAELPVGRALRQPLLLGHLDGRLASLGDRHVDSHAECVVARLMASDDDGAAMHPRVLPPPSAD